MSRYRKCECEIWTDDKFPYLPDNTQLVWFHLYTYPQSTGLGIYMASIEGLWANKNKNGETSLERYREGFENLVKHGLIEYDERNQVVFFPKFFDRSTNKPENPNVFTSLLKCWGDIPRHSPLKRKLFNKLETLSKRWGKRYEEVFETLAGTLPQTYTPPSPKQEQEQDREPETFQGTLPEKEQDPEQDQEKTLVEPSAQPESGQKQLPVGAKVHSIFQYWQTKLNHPQAKLDEKRRKKITQILKLGYTEEDCKHAIDGNAVSPYHQGDNDNGTKYDSIELIFRDADHIDRFIRFSKTPPKPRTKANQRLDGNINAANRAMSMIDGQDNDT